ncbi:MAG: hypothetical protein QW168_03435 [Sulfolobales archaeon]
MSVGALLEISLAHRSCELVLDTSALLLITYGVDPVSEAIVILKNYCPDIRVSLLTSVVQELNRLAKGRGRKGVAARLALARLSKQDIAIGLIEFSGCSRTDECILEYSRTARSFEVIVATTDRRLAKTLKESGVKYIIWWKSKRKFVMEPPVWDS